MEKAEAIFWQRYHEYYEFMKRKLAEKQHEFSTKRFKRFCREFHKALSFCNKQI